MWGDWLEKGKELANKAQAVALDLDKQLNESVGLEPVAPAVTAPTVEDDGALDDTWDAEEEESGALDSRVPSEPTEPTPGADPVEAPPAEEANQEEKAHDEENPEDYVQSAGDLETAVEEVPTNDHPTDQPEVDNEDGWENEEDLDIDLNELPSETLRDPESNSDSELDLDPKVEDPSSAATAEKQPRVEETPQLASEQDHVSTTVEDRQKDVVLVEERLPIERITPEPIEKVVSRTEAHHSGALEPASNFQDSSVLELELKELRDQLRQREEQLLSKTAQLTTIQAMHESEKAEFQQKIQNTKEEAKRRIQKAKERVEAIEAQLDTATRTSHSSSEDAAKQAELVNALRAEGQKLAMKQADMEKAVRTAKGEARELREKLVDETEAKDKALAKIVELQSDLAATKENLQSARRGESLAEKLEATALQAKEDSEKKAATILSLEQSNKELTQQVKELQEELDMSKQGAVADSLREQKKLRKEHNDAIADLEAKFHKSEKEAAAREDTLRKEVEDFRKRWQDAVRRADELSVDVHSSTAPLLRQLESANRQHRARASAWTELETSLRGELEEAVIANEKLSKERSEWKTKYSRIERAASEQETELNRVTAELEDKIAYARHAEESLERLKGEFAKLKDDYAEAQRAASEGVSKVRHEMAQTVLDIENRHSAQLDSLRAELAVEQDKTGELQQQLKEMLQNDGITIPSVSSSTLTKAEKPKQLRQSEDQINILSDALGLDDGDDEDGAESFVPNNDSSGSYAALAQYASKWKAANAELAALRQRLSESETLREEMVEELNDARVAKEKLPFFQEKVNELSAANEEMSYDIQAHDEDMDEMRTSYQSQIAALTALLSSNDTTASVRAPTDEQEQVEDEPVAATEEDLAS